jgi:hypothetical protein
MYKSIIKPQFFCYATEIVTVPANGSIEPQIDFSNDSDFIVDEIRQTEQTTGALLIQLSLQAGERYSNEALDTAQFTEGFNGKKFFGVNGNQPRIPANTNLNITLINTTGADIEHQVQLWGYKVEKLY